MIILETEKADGRLVDICGYLPFSLHQLRVPSSASRSVVRTPDVPELSISLVFSEKTGRFEINHLSFFGKGPSGPYVSSKSFTELSLPSIVREIGTEIVPNSDYWLSAPEEVSDDYIVQLYWFEHLLWGKPRSEIMKVTGWSRANTNHHIRRLAKEFDLPGPHSKADS
jgi:hypothetical protein